METKIHTDIIEVHAQFNPVSPEDPNYDEAREAEYLQWWEAEGQHTSYFRASLLDARQEPHTSLDILSPYFRRDNAEAREKARTMLNTAVKGAIAKRLESKP